MAKELLRVRAQLAQKCNKALIDGLLDDLLDAGIFSFSEVADNQEGHASCGDRCRSLVDMVRKKGDPSCNFLLQKLSERDKYLSNSLKITVSGCVDKKTTEPPKNSEINEITLCSEEEIQRILQTEGSKMYPMLPREGRKRQALIICNINFKTLQERKGAKKDLEGMTSLLQDFGYQVTSWENLTSEDMLESMKTFAGLEEHAYSDSTFIVLMSHGLRDAICGINSEQREQNGQTVITDLLKTDEIFTIFNNVNCAKLRRKPKVIIIQACRGEEKSRVWANDSVNHPSGELESDVMVHKESDFICFCSSTPDTLSWRSPKLGSLFIIKLIEIIKREAHSSSLEDIFREVQLCFENDKQMPAQERKTLLKKMFLLPGY